MNALDKQIYDANEVAAILRISYRTLLRIIKRGDIKVSRIGNQYRITKEELERVLKTTN